MSEDRETWEQRLTSKFKDWDELQRLASCWLTCAIGENRKTLEQRGYVFEIGGCPDNNELYRLGVKFYDAIVDGQTNDALNIYHTIQKLEKLNCDYPIDC